jgi:hypothetical protein
MRILNCCVGLALLVHGAAGAMASVVPTPADLARSVAEARAAITAVDGTVLSEKVRGGGIPLMESRHAWAPGKIRVERARMVGSREARFIATFDGKTFWVAQSLTRILVKRGEPDGHFVRDGFGLFELMAFFPDVAGLEPKRSRDLQHLLARQGVAVRDAMEAIGDAECVVVDVPAPPGGSRWTIWIDPAASYQPRRQVASRDDGTEILRIEIEEFVEVEGVHVPIRATRVSPRLGGEAAIEYRMHVPPGADGKPAIRVNKAVPDAVFDASNVVSSGWMISDRTTGETRRVN